MAGALSYIHAIVPVNISGLAHAVNNFKEDVCTLLALYHKNRQLTGLANDEFYHQRILDLFTLASSDADTIRVTRLGEISPFGRFFMVLGEFFL